MPRNRSRSEDNRYQVSWARVSVGASAAAVCSSAVSRSAASVTPFVVRIGLDDKSILERLPAGSTAVAAIFTDHVKPATSSGKVVLRQLAILNYINPF